jgi:uncharacterized protein YdeI (BOF family)
MKRLFAALSLALLVSMVVGAGVALAQATTETSSEEYDISGPIKNPCNDQMVQFTGTQRYVFHVTDDAAGNHHIFSKVTTQGSGVDPVTGEKFLFRVREGIQEFYAQDGAPAAFTNIVTAEAISQGPSPDFLHHVTYLIRVNANGEPTVEQENIVLECKGQENPPEPA